MKENHFWIEELFLKVDDFYSKGEFAEGKKILEEILESEPGYGRAHNHLGWLYYVKFDDFERAEYHYKLAIKFANDYPGTYMNLTYLLNYLNRYGELKKHVDVALNIDGTVKSVLYNELGKAHEINGFYAEASKAYKAAIRFSLNKDEMATLNENLLRVKNKVNLFERKFMFF
ncbi:MAG: tetratricopeptide repeat protein [Bacteroidia bacterium]|nr:tetratricopeptide repeat protein [Bacteroidia bacterium]